MPNEDFSIKTGIEVDDSKVSQLKSIADELEKTAKALQKINNVKFNGDIFSGLTNAGKNIQNVTKEIDKLQKSANGAGKPLNNIGKGAESIVSGNSTQFTLLDLTSIDVIKSSMSEIADSAQNLKEALGSEVTSGLMTQIDAMLAKKDELQNLANILKSNKKDLGKAAKATGSSNKKSANNTSSSTSTKTPKYITDQSYVGDYKTLADNEAFVHTLSTFRHNTTEAQAAIEERNKVMARVNAKTPQNTSEINAKQRFDDIDRTITDNLSKYGDRIHSAYNAFDKIKADKSGIAGIEDVFKSSEEQINKWATAVAKGKMSIGEFEKKVSGLSGSVGSIGKIIDPASITDAKGELESYLRELTNVQDITFSGFTEKNGIVSLKGTFKDSAGEAQTLSVQLNTLNGQIKNLGTSVKPVESGLSKFFSGWKEKMVNLAQYLTSFQAMNQVWNTFKQGLEIVKEFDTALTEMRKVSDEPISKLKEFQKESFDMAKSVGTTALQIQNSTADFMRLGQSMEEAKQSSVNANILKNVSEFDNVDDATSALISMQAAYKDLTQTELIDKLDNIGNRYAVATDELATGLQKSGATLSLMGNNIDESVALLTAANSQIQNIDTVAAGEKVISLRIAGRLCLNILEGMGKYLYLLVDNYIGRGLGTDNTEVRPIFI
nr:MAG TPA: minor tail protein [Caudoviricetes sp.]